MTTTFDADVLVVGAGLAGLMAAAELVEHGQRPLLVDKGRSVGGRLATRRIGPGRADHGAQFMTVRSPRFAAYVERWIAAGLVYQWSTGWSDGSLAAGPRDGHPRYAVHGGMNALTKHLAGELSAQHVPIYTAWRATRIEQLQDGWRASSDTGEQITARAALLTAPAPQSLELLKAGAVALSAADRAALQAIAYAPCLCGLFWVEGDLLLPPEGAVQRPAHDFAWIADNRRKGISPDASILTVHAGPAWSAAHYDRPDNEVLDLLKSEALRWAAGSAVIRSAEIKRWRYAVPTALHPQPFLRAAGLPPLLFAGDAFGSPRIEGAALSGLAAAEQVE